MYFQEEGDDEVEYEDVDDQDVVKKRMKTA